ncbi:hypothetical protein cyc_03694 [Cyclospora cayetanensis]|uniref:Replication factor Mcm10 C-terminal domain-containing protein n=1 Tax=Cyclospora cayetanensis TaxID=88456 RepID=A0A1D3CSW8_9EIME|nr:hypothetical protein cyc_03694 [Cyclospora cayetanensis]
MTADPLKVKCDCVFLDGKQLDIEKWALPFEEVACRFERPDLKVISLQKTCNCVSLDRSETFERLNFQCPTVLMPNCEMKWWWVLWDVKETNLFLSFRGEELWSCLRSGATSLGLEVPTVPSLQAFLSRALRLDDWHWWCWAHRKKGVKRGDLVALLNPSLLPKSNGADSRAATVEDEDQILLVLTLTSPSMGEYCRFHVNVKNQRSTGLRASLVEESIDELLCGSNKEKRAEILRKIAPSAGAHADAAADPRSADLAATSLAPLQVDTAQQKQIKQQAMNKLLQQNLLLQQSSSKSAPPANSCDDQGSAEKPSKIAAAATKPVRSTITSTARGEPPESSKPSWNIANLGNAADRERQAVEAFVKKLQEIVALPASSNRDMALAIQLSLAKRMRFDCVPRLAETAKELHTQLFLHPNSVSHISRVSADNAGFKRLRFLTCIRDRLNRVPLFHSLLLQQDLALLAFKNYRYIHCIATITPRPQRVHEQTQVQSSTKVKTAAVDSVAVASRRHSGTAAANEQCQQLPPPPPLESATDVRRALRSLQQKQKLVSSTVSTLKQTKKAGDVLQNVVAAQQKRLLKEQQRSERASKALRTAATVPPPAAAGKPALTEEEKKRLLEKILQLKSSVADIEDGQRHLERLRSLEAADISHEFKQSIKETTVNAFFCLQCKKYTDRLNTACVARNHQQQPRRATKRFVQCENCGHKPIPTLNNQLPDGCPKCRVASKDISFRLIPLYTAKPEKLLEQEKLTIDGTDVGPYKKQQERPPQCRDENSAEGFFDHHDLPDTS